MLKILLVALALLVIALLLLSRVGARLIERRFPPIGDFVEVDGVRLHYVSAGEGTALVLLHGANSNLRDFHSSIFEPLSRHYRVIAFDRPGYGYSQRPSGKWPTPGKIAGLVLDAAEKLGAEKPLLVGHSWAGSVVMAGLVKHPERVSGGVLISGVASHWAGTVDWTYTLGGWPLLGPLFARMMVYPAGLFMLDGAVRSVLAPNPLPDGYADNIGAALALRPRNYLHNVQDMNRLSLYMQTLSTRYETIEQPLLVIHGEADRSVPFWNHGRRLLPVVRDVEICLLPDTGHAPHHSHPREVVNALLAFGARIGHAPSLARAS